MKKIKQSILKLTPLLILFPSTGAFANINDLNVKININPVLEATVRVKKDTTTEHTFSFPKGTQEYDNMFQESGCLQSLESIFNGVFTTENEDVVNELKKTAAALKNIYGESLLPDDKIIPVDVGLKITLNARSSSSRRFEESSSNITFTLSVLNKVVRTYPVASGFNGLSCNTFSFPQYYPSPKSTQDKNISLAIRNIIIGGRDLLLPKHKASEEANKITSDWLKEYKRDEGKGLFEALESIFNN